MRVKLHTAPPRRGGAAGHLVGSALRVDLFTYSGLWVLNLVGVRRRAGRLGGGASAGAQPQRRKPCSQLLSIRHIASSSCSQPLSCPAMTQNSVGVTFIPINVMAALLLCAPGCGVAQQFNHNFETTCDMGTLYARLDSLTSECCTVNEQVSCDGPACSTSCIGVLMPLLDDCHDTINRLFDADDGVEDGHDRIISNAYDQCAATPPATLINDLKALQERGQCPATVLDGVAATEVKAPGCVDRWDGDRCSVSIASGVMTCEHDFCNAVYPPCVMAGQCDRSCNLCADGDGSGHRRLLAILQQLRQLQMSHMTCSPSSFEADAAAVDEACCDGEQGCVDGIPGECDAKCAVVFNSFYPRCQRFLASQLSLADMAGYDQLFSTCTRALPAEPLLRALVVCSANPPDPCFEVDCGEHSNCDGGTCQCEDGYSGESCQVYDPCFEVDCGEHGSCDGGSCTCHDGYTGSRCEVDNRPECRSTWCQRVVRSSCHGDSRGCGPGCGGPSGWQSHPTSNCR
eukprot:SAG31_NODE_2010_length_6670_cov_3.036220_2_plen_514_part_00